MLNTMPPDSVLIKGLAYKLCFPENHTIEVFLQWEGQLKWNLYLRKSEWFQVTLTVAHTAAIGSVFRFLALMLFCIKVTLREEGS
jgi:hypothetical protein